VSTPADAPQTTHLNAWTDVPSPPRVSAEQVVERLRPWETTARSDAARRPRVLLNMVCTVDGRATLGGRSGPISSPADRELFHALRAGVDAVLVGAGTARAERYGRLVREESHRRLRRERGLAEEPLACIVSASLDLAGTIPLLGEAGAHVVILTPSPAGELAASAATVEYVRTDRAGTLDLSQALVQLGERWGVRSMLCEGGPHLNGALLAAGLVDELFLSLAPKLGGGEDPAAALRIVCGPELDPPLQLRLNEVLESEGCLLLRYGVDGGSERERRAPMRPRPV
jgi:riboflavin-specific deaminase-like protein